jgi:hypothetical protein
MDDPLRGSKTRLALDPDWRSALGMLWLFLLFTFFAVGTAGKTSRGSFTVPAVGWLTVLLAVVCIYFGVVLPDRRFKIAAFVASVGPVSRILLLLLKATSETKLINTLFVRWIDAGLYFAGAVYAVYWFGKKITHV